LITGLCDDVKGGRGFEAPPPLRSTLFLAHFFNPLRSDVSKNMNVLIICFIVEAEVAILIESNTDHLADPLIFYPKLLANEESNQTNNRAAICRCYDQSQLI